MTVMPSSSTMVGGPPIQSSAQEDMQAAAGEDRGDVDRFGSPPHRRHQ
jgi:hypothetical protein